MSCFFVNQVLKKFMNNFLLSPTQPHRAESIGAVKKAPPPTPPHREGSLQVLDYQAPLPVGRGWG